MLRTIALQAWESARLHPWFHSCSARLQKQDINTEARGFRFNDQLVSVSRDLWAMSEIASNLASKHVCFAVLRKMNRHYRRSNGRLRIHSTIESTPMEACKHTLRDRAGPCIRLEMKAWSFPSDVHLSYNPDMVTDGVKPNRIPPFRQKDSASSPRNAAWRRRRWRDLTRRHR